MDGNFIADVRLDDSDEVGEQTFAEGRLPAKRNRTQTACMLDAL